MTDAVIYARFSSDMQREESIDASEIAKIDKKISNVSHAITDGVYTPELKNTLNELSDQHRQLQIHLFELESVPDAKNKTSEEIKAEFASCADFGKLAPDRQKVVIQKFINRVSCLSPR